MNNLNRNIKAGEEVIVKKEDFADQDSQEKDRIFICESGYGMSSFTSGGKIFGAWKMDGSKGMIRGVNIDAEATMKHQAKTRFGIGKTNGGRGG